VLRTPAALRIVADAGSGSGTIRSTPSGIACRVTDGSATGSCEFTFPGEARVSLTSTADDGSVPLRWGAACAGEQPGSVCVVDMDQPRIVTASYTALRRVVVSSAATAWDG
jgi:hypothetical protein